MAARRGRRAFARLTVGVLAAIGAVVAVHQGARSPSVRAAYRAFRDPTLLDPHASTTSPAPASVSCARLAAGEERALDADFSLTLDRPLPADLDDPDGATLRTLVLPDLHVPITRRTMRFVRFLTRTEPGRAAFVQRHRRASLYRESVAFALREAGLPEDLLWLVGIESGFDPRAVSQAGASGLFQLMPETAQLYGLDMSPWVDERRSIVRATKAAVTHLRDLYERFGRWDLALAAYNAGYDRVASAMEKVALSRGAGPARLEDRPIGFADLAAARALPEETINYVPQIVAFAICAANRSRFGLDGPELGAPLEVGEIAVPEGTRLRTLARAAGVSVAVLREYNPQLLRDRVPPVGGDYLVALPEGRVQRALAAFPSYSDQEVLAENEGDAADEGSRVPPLGSGMAMDPDALGDDPPEDPLPRRPVALGRNRLPEVMPGRERVLMTAASFGVGMLEAKLPRSLAIPDLGWRRSFAEDPLGVLGERRGGAMQASSMRGREAAIDKQLGFLDAIPTVEALRSFALPNGITVRVRRDRGASTAAITVRVATVEDAGEGSDSIFRLARRGAEVGASEALHTITVDRADADAGIELAAARLRLALGDTRATEIAEIRFRAGGARRKQLQDAPYGQAWLALGEALFPADHPLAGTVLGAGDEGAALRDMMVAEAMQREHARARGSITVVGDVDELHARKLAEAFLAPLPAPSDVPVLPHLHEDRLTVEEDVPAPRLLLGWITPGEGDPGDASLRVAMELLENPRLGPRQRAFGGHEGREGRNAHAALEVWPRAGVASIEVPCAPGHEPAEALRALDAELDRLADEGPTGGDVAAARILVRARLEKERAAAGAAGIAGRDGAVHSADLAKLRHALRPWAVERVEKAIDEVTVGSVRAAVKRLLARDRRVIVTTIPRVR